MAASTVDRADFAKRFSEFFELRLRPEIQAILARRRAGMKRAIVAAGVVFLVILGVMYYFLHPHLELLADRKFIVMGLMLFTPLSISVLAFGIVYILSLRTLVGDFQEAVINRLAEFIDPAIVHETGRTIPDQIFRRSLLFGEGWTPTSGSEHFRGRMGRIGYEFSEVRVAAPGGRVFAGLFLNATFARRFKTFAVMMPREFMPEPARIDAAVRQQVTGVVGEAQVAENPVTGLPLALGVPAGGAYPEAFSAVLMLRLAELIYTRRLGPFVSCAGDMMCIALLAEVKTADAPGYLDGFDFSRCREFCRDVEACLDLVVQLDGDEDMWE